MMAVRARRDRPLHLYLYLGAHKYAAVLCPSVTVYALYFSSVFLIRYAINHAGRAISARARRIQIARPPLEFAFLWLFKEMAFAKPHGELLMFAPDERNKSKSGVINRDIARANAELWGLRSSCIEIAIRRERERERDMDAV